MDPFHLFEKSTQHRGPLLLMVATIVMCLLWAGLTKIDQHVNATGHVVPSGKVRSIQHLEGGIVNEILVREGQEVEKGAPLFSIVNRHAESELRESEISLDYLLIKQERLRAEQRGLETPEFDQRLIDTYPEIVKAETNLFNGRTQQFKQKIDGLRQEINQKTLRLDELSKTDKNIRQQALMAQKQLIIKRNLYKSGAVSQSQYLDAQSAVQDFVTKIQKNEAEIPIVQAELAEAQNNLTEAEQTRQAEIAEDLNNIQVDAKRTKERSEAMRDQVDRTSIVSPVKGIVNKLGINTIGAVVKPGDTIAEILPLDETLEVSGQMNVNDRGKVWIGLPVVAKVTAYEYSVYGGIKGTLSYISADSFTDSRGREFYQIKVTLNAQSLGADKPIYPGMVVDLNIMAGKVSVMQALLKPFLKIGNAALREP